MPSFNLWPDPNFGLRVQGLGLRDSALRFGTLGPSFKDWAARLRGRFLSPCSSLDVSRFLLKVRLELQSKGCMILSEHAGLGQS